jgi:hypothetical protein
MMETKHAPGPYEARIDKWACTEICELYDREGRMICSNAVRGGTDYDPFDKDTARKTFALLAAAPELLAACEEAMKVIVDPWHIENTSLLRAFTTLSTAVAKAKG